MRSVNILIWLRVFRFTEDLVDTEGEQAYPLIGYTYMILRMAAFDDGKKATQLYRYIDWFTTDPAALREAETHYMAPVRSASSAETYITQ